MASYVPDVFKPKKPPIKKPSGKINIDKSELADLSGGGVGKINESSKKKHERLLGKLHTTRPFKQPKKIPKVKEKGIKFAGGKDVFEQATGNKLVLEESGGEPVGTVNTRTGEQTEGFGEFAGSASEAAEALLITGAKALPASAGGHVTNTAKLGKDINSLLRIGKPAVRTVTTTTTSGGGAGKTVVNVAINTKTVKQASNILSLNFGTKALAAYGAWMGGTFFGLWGQAEAPEPLSITNTKFLIPDAEKTGDWSLVDESYAEQEAILDLEKWEEIILKTPLSPAIGIVNKIKGARAALNMQKKYTEHKRQQQLSGESEDELWVRRRQEEVDQKKTIVDYSNEQFKISRDNERASEKAARDVAMRERRTEASNVRDEEIKAMRDDARFWREQQAKVREDEAADRLAVAQFWIAYRKLANEIAQNNAPSKLSFGLL